MAKQSGTAIQLDAGTLTNTLEEVKEVDVKLTAIQGTQAQRIAEAKMSILDQPMPAILDHLPVFTQDVETTYGDIVEFIEGTLASFLAEVEQDANEAVQGWLTSNKSANAEEFDTLKEQRSTLVERAKALQTLLGIANEGEFEIPKRSSGGRPAGSGGVKVSTGQWYVVTAKGRKDMAPSQNSLSSVAWYYGAALCPDCPTTNNEKGVNSATLKGTVERVLGSTMPATSWEAVLPGGTIGFEVIDTPTEEVEAE